MKTKPTARIDEKLIERAPHPQTPTVKSLRGVLAGSGLGEGDFRRHLEEKWSPDFFEWLSAVDCETAAAVDEMLASVRKARSSTKTE